MNIIIIGVGKLKETYLRDGIAEYAKRLTKYCRFEIIEVPDEKIPDSPSAGETARVLTAEAKNIAEKIPKNALVAALAVEGDQVTSPGLAEWIAGVANGGIAKICFIIGGSLGLTDDIKRSADRLFSFSALTFPHQLMRLIVTEQLYRAFTILNHTSYHK
ncbi:MAG: 23S rRNA (pseudouridine(1915)-N(3))-methyltransferase RlmH [bacterium]